MPPSNPEKTASTSAILHDLGAPLTAARGWAELLCEADLGGKRGAWAERVRDCLAEMAEILAGSTEAGVFSPVEEVEALATALGQRARETGTRFLCSQGGRGPWRVRGARTAFRRIAANLMSNVLRHAPGGNAEVRVALRRATRGWRLRLEVADEGPGLGRGAAEALFRAGEKGRDSGGKGLGLHIVRELAKANGGEAGATGGARGARFWAELLVREAEGRAPLPTLPRPVLILVGSPRRRRWLASLLTGWNIPCAAARLNATPGQIARASQGLGGGALVLSERDSPELPQGVSGWVTLGEDTPCGPGSLIRALGGGEVGDRLAKGGLIASVRGSDAQDQGQAPA